MKSQNLFVLCFLCPLCVLCASLPAAWNVNGVALAHAGRRGGGYGSEDCRQQLKVIVSLGGNWVAVSDFAWMGGVNEPHVRFGWSDEAEGIPQVIRDAHAAGLKVLVKPHLWSRDFGRAGKWHGDIRMTSEADWDTWFKEYGDYILAQAKQAASAGAEAFCVGVEYDGTIDQDRRWRKLIGDVRAVYPGKLTYASSCFSWKKVPWWDALDCIGIDAYFTVATSANASEDELRAGWAKVYDDMEPDVRRIGKQVCFTELGYTPSADAGKQPWASAVIEPSPEYQARLYKVAIEEAQKRDYVVGAFVWKWFTSPSRNGGWGRGDPFGVQDRELVRDALREAWGGEAASTRPSADGRTSAPAPATSRATANVPPARAVGFVRRTASAAGN